MAFHAPGLSESHKIGKVAAHVPDLVVYGDLPGELPYTKNLHGVLLFADVSGFTALTEKFSMANKKGYGADQLTKTLNNYIGDIVDHVLMAGGDILNFAGDALLALWNVERIQLSEVITLAVKCSMDIQKECGVRDTEVGVELRVKIGISAGRISKVVIGNQEQEFFVVVGRAVDEVRLAEGLAEASNIILSPNAWELCDRDTIVSDKIEKERAVKLRYIKKQPEFDLESYLRNYGHHLQHEQFAHETCRKVSQLKPNDALEKTLRKYVTGTVLQKIDDDQPLEYLSEMRPVTTLFLNLQFKDGAKIDHQCKAMQETSNGISRVISKYKGRINKVFMFDKGCTFLCIFGLPGDKQEDECTHALRCAFKIYVFCNEQLRKIRVVSIGVTNGPVFCGVVGHALRHEYTVIGRKVNLAARMMMHYPGLVSCDEETFRDSRLPAYFFNELPKKAMKGVKTPGIIYQFQGDKEKTEIGKSHLTMERDLRYPLLGRETEMQLFMAALNNFLKNRGENWRDSQRAVLFEGAPGYGKSRILAEINFLTQREGYRVVAMELAKINVKQSFYAIQTLMAMFLHIEVCKSYTEREKVIQSKLLDPETQERLCLLNSLFFVKFPVSQEVSLMDSDTKKKELEKFLMNILQQACQGDTPLLIIIDQAHYIDWDSWNFLAELFNTQRIFLIMALCPFNHDRPPCDSAVKVMRSTETTYINIKALKPSIIPDLACQTLGVVSIPLEVETLLMERSYGIPYYCEEVLKSLFFNKSITLEPQEEQEEDETDVLFTRKISTTSTAWKMRRASLGKWQQMNPRKVMSLTRDGTEEDISYICSLNEAVKLQNIPLPFTLKGIALSQLDYMTTAEQMVVKCAAVIGQTFLFRLLRYILPDRAQKKLVQTLMSLVRSRIFECASQKKEYSSDPGKYGFCSCPDEMEEEPGSDTDEAEILGGLQEAWTCKIMRFCTPLLQETAYELWLKEQVKDLHLKCAKFLEKRAQKCSSCGGGEFILAHRLAVDHVPSEYELSSVNLEADINSQASKLTQQTLEKLKISEKAEHPVQVSLKRLELPKTFMETSPGATTVAPGDECAAQPGSSSGEDMGLNKHQRKTSTSKSAKIQAHSSNPIMAAVEPRNEAEFLAQLDLILEQLREKHLTKPRDCMCAHIRDTVIVALAWHWMGVGDVAKAIYYLLEAAAASLYLSSNYMALSYLNEAAFNVDLVKNRKRKSELYEITSSKVKIHQFEVACMHSLKAEVFFNMGRITESRNLLKEALSILNRHFPYTDACVLIKLVTEKFKNSMYQRRRMSPPQEHQSQETRLPYLYEQVHCLSLLWQIYSMNARADAKLRSLLAALMEVNSAEQSRSNAKIISSYMDCFQCCQVMGIREHCKRFEMMALQLSTHLPLTFEGLLVATKLAHALANVKLCFGHLKEAIEFGNRSHSLSVLLNRPTVECVVLPTLFKALFLQERYDESIAVVHLLEAATKKQPTVILQTWLYTVCLDVLLQGGFAFKSFEDCLDFVSKYHTDSILLAENRLMLSLLSSVALWFARIEDWDLFRPAFKKAKKLVVHTNASYHAVHGYATFLECQVLLLRKVIMEKSDNIDEVKEKTLKHLSIFMSLCITTPVFYDRALHLKAFVFMLCGKKAAAGVVLQKALVSSQKHENKQEESWIKLSNDTWFGADSYPVDLWLTATADMPFWEEASKIDRKTLCQTKFLLQLPNSESDEQGPVELDTLSSVALLTPDMLQ